MHVLRGGRTAVQRSIFQPKSFFAPMGWVRRGAPDLMRLLLGCWGCCCSCGVHRHLRGSCRNHHLPRPHGCRPRRSRLRVVVLWRVLSSVCACDTSNPSCWDTSTMVLLCQNLSIRIDVASLPASQA